MIGKRALPFLVLVLGISALAAQTGDFLPRKALVVVSDDNYPPYIFKDSGGKLQGIIPDQWELWSRETGIPVKLIGKSWNLALEMMKKGEADVLDTVFITPERQKIWDFTKPYATINVPVYISDSVSGINGAASLEGFLVGVKDGDACIGQLTGAGVFNLKRYPGYEEIVKDAAAGNIHLFCVDEPPALYYIHKFRLTDKFREAFVLNSGQFHRAVRKGDAETLSLVQNGFDRIGAAQYQGIDRKWMGKRLIGAGTFRTLRTVGLITLAGILALTALVLYLRVMIRRRTGELARTVARLRESEAAATALLQANPDLLFILDERGAILQVKASPSMPLYARPEDFLGKSIKESVPEALAERTIAAIDRILGGQARETMEYALEVGGTLRCYEARMLRMGEKRVLSIIRDITERKEREDETIRTHKLDSIGVFAGGIAHDFNNILTTIEGNISLAKAHPGIPEACSAYLANAESAADRAGSLTSQLLAFAKGGTPVRSGISLASVVKEAASFALSGSSCALKAETADGPLFAMADRNQIAQVIHNLVLNASQAMPDGGAVGLKMAVAELKSGNHLGLYPGDYVSIAISDSGPGIPAENLHRIFDPYFTTKPGGTGLGLSICHSIVKHHGGGIDVYSRPGEGSVFTVFIPAAKGDYSPSESERASEGAKPRENVRALVMDDEESIRQFLDELLKGMGIPHELAENGERGLELFDAAAKEGRPFDIVFADLTVAGGMGGKEMMSAMRKSGIAFKSVVISGYSNDPIMSNYKPNGFDACLMKPFKIPEFRNVVERLLGKA